MNEIVFRTDLQRFKPVLGELYVVMRMPKNEPPRLHLAYYTQKRRFIRRRDLVRIMDYVAVDWRWDESRRDYEFYHEQDKEILGIQKANANAILAFVKLWKDGPADFLRFVQTWKKTERLKKSEIENVERIAREEVRRQKTTKTAKKKRTAKS